VYTRLSGAPSASSPLAPCATALSWPAGFQSIRERRLLRAVNRPDVVGSSSGRRRTREAFRHRSASTLDTGRPIRMRAGGGGGQVKGDLADRTQRDGKTVLALLFSFPTRMTPDPLILTMSYGGNLSGLTVGACSA